MARIVPLARRLVEVIADLGSGQYRYGSGCIVAGRTVLTAAHVVVNAQRVAVRGVDKQRLACAALDPRFVGDPTAVSAGPDLALVEIEDTNVDLPAMGLARVDRDSAFAEVVERCHAWGYPRFTEVPRDRHDDQALRETCDAAGMVPVGSGLVLGLLDLQVSVAPRDLPLSNQPLATSPWAGISGGPVIAGGLLLGVVSEHAPRSGPGSLTATPVTAITPDHRHPQWGPGVTDPKAWWKRLGVSDPASLTVLPPRPVSQPPPYAATLRSMGRTFRTRMNRLQGREKELAAISLFATSDQGYRWLVGGAFTGKSALMYHAVTAALPENVDVVSYFLRRVASDADSTKFLAAVVPQLAAICGEEAISGYDVHRYRALWEQAVTRAHESGRHLLMVVDGLDEDLLQPQTASVASLLPDLVAGVDPSASHAHVHVTSRPHPDLPSDIAENTGHPLCHAPHVPLSGFPGWERLRDLGAFEIDQLVGSGTLARDVLGILAAAAGPLSPADIAHLHSIAGIGSSDSYDMEQFLSSRSARALEPVGPASSRRFQFAHATLLDHARGHKALANPTYRQRIRSWAEAWEQAGWPEPLEETGTPLYLIDTYPSTLRDSADLSSLICNIDWVNAAIRTLGVDSTMEFLHVGSRRSADGNLLDLLCTVTAQQGNLRRKCPPDDRGYVLRQLCLQALEFEFDDLAGKLRARMEELAVSTAGPIPLWTTLRSRPPALELGTHAGTVRAIVAVPDGRVATLGEDGQFLIWNPDDAGSPRELAAFNSWVTGLGVMPDGRIITGGRDGRLKLWHADDPAHTTEISGDRGDHLVAVLPDGRIVTSCDRGAWLWRPDDSSHRTELVTAGPVTAAAMLPDGRVHHRRTRQAASNLGPQPSSRTYRTRH